MSAINSVSALLTALRAHLSGYDLPDSLGSLRLTTRPPGVWLAPGATSPAHLETAITVSETTPGEARQRSQSWALTTLSVAVLYHLRTPVDAAADTVTALQVEEAVRARVLDDAGWLTTGRATWTRSTREAAPYDGWLLLTSTFTASHPLSL